MGEPLTHDNRVYGLSLGIAPKQYCSKDDVIAVFVYIDEHFEYLRNIMQIQRAMNYLHQLQVSNVPKE